MKKFLAIVFLVSISLQVIGQVFTLGSNKKGDFDILINQAEQKRRDGKYDSSLILLNNALKIAESQEDLEWKAKAKNEIGLLAIYQGKFAKALEYIQESLAIYEHLKIEEGIAIVLITLPLYNIRKKTMSLHVKILPKV